MFFTEIRKNLLRDEGFIKSSQLTPIKRKFYKEVVKLKAKVQRMSNSKASLKSKLCVAKKFIKSNIYKGFQEKINKTTLEFIESQVGNQHKKLNGRRYTLNDKIFALSIFKTSPKAYKFLSNIFALPCETTLNNLLEKIPFIPGINSHIEENMKHQVKQLKPMDRTCIILFDEMALEPGLKYDKKNDLMLGFENFGKTVTNKFADHVLVFMIKGVSKKWKQPYAYYFCQGTTKTNQLVTCIKEVVKSVKSTGLNIIASVCDQGPTNRSAINHLLNETEAYYKNKEMHRVAYEIDNVEIIPIYDVPHLTKCLRNNLLTKDLEFVMNGKKLQASWDHIIELFNIDKANENYEIRALPKLTEAHVYPYKQKLKVCLATQVFSQRVSSVMKLLSRPMFQNNKLKDSDGTADLLLFVDKTFDSLNASRSIPDASKPLSGAIKIESEDVHLNHWNQAIRVFQSMKFIDKIIKNSLARQPPCINN